MTDRDQEIQDIERILWLDSVQKKLDNPDTARTLTQGDLMKAKIIAEQQVHLTRMKMIDYEALSNQVSQRLYSNRVEAEVHDRYRTP